MMRVGLGYDIHRLVVGRRLVLGGVEIPHDRGLLGHSDGDAVLHAITDALLGAAGLGDIGEMFPDDDDRLAGADSAVLLAAALERVRDAGWRPVNADVNVLAEAPRLKPYKDTIRKRVAGLLGVDGSAVSIKARTKERLDAVGNEEAIEVHCVVLVQAAGAP